MKIIERCEKWFNKIDYGTTFTRNDVAEAVGISNRDLSWFFNKMKEKGLIQMVSRDSYLTTYMKTKPGQFIKTYDPMSEFLRMKLI